jgi:hypothetical protein
VWLHRTYGPALEFWAKWLDRRVVVHLRLHGFDFYRRNEELLLLGEAKRVLCPFQALEIQGKSESVTTHNALCNNAFCNELCIAVAIFYRARYARGDHRQRFDRSICGFRIAEVQS